MAPPAGARPAPLQVPSGDEADGAARAAAPLPLPSATHGGRRRVPGTLRVSSASGGGSAPFPLVGTPRAADVAPQPRWSVAAGGAPALPPPPPSPPSPAPPHAPAPSIIGDSPITAAAAAASPPPADAPGGARAARFRRALDAPVVDVDALRELAWSGVPAELRPATWRLLFGLAPPPADRRAAALQRKRREYRDLVAQHFAVASSARSDEEAATLRQIGLDAPRTAPGSAFARCAAVQGALRRLLLVRAVRSSAAGYVQGMSDLVVPFLQVFLSEAACTGDTGADWPHQLDRLSAQQLALLAAGGGGDAACDARAAARAAAIAAEDAHDATAAGGPPSPAPRAGSGASPEAVRAFSDAEADSYWCLCKLLDGIQDFYTFAQPGLQRKVAALAALVRRCDPACDAHLEAQGLEYLQFAFRWVNCLLLRELPAHLAPRLLDAYAAEGDGFADFLLYALGAFVLRWSADVRARDFQDLIMFLQAPPSATWREPDLALMLTQAHLLRLQAKAERDAA